MQPTLARLVRVIPKSKVAAEYASAAPARQLLEQARSDIKPPTLIESLQARKAKLGADYPPNIRIEPVLSKKTFEGVPEATRERLQELLKGR